MLVRQKCTEGKYQIIIKAELNMAVVICDKANRQIKRKRRMTVANEACYALLFFDKEYILISRRYQFDPACPSGNTDAHN
jgi:predicted nucleotide-binding protein (sugar kinase/HSP70/actin superfamily)